MAQRKLLIIRHVAFEDLGSFEALFSGRGFVLETLDAGVDELEEPLLAADLAVILGGPIGVYEEETYPFLVAELSALSRRLSRRRPTLGICLGAQLMARALGARVYPGGKKEIGWGPIELTEAGRASCLLPFAGQPVLHWHGDTFDLPEGAALLASTALYRNQAFSLGPELLGVQFHPEVEPREFERWLIGHAVELGQAKIDIAALRASVKGGGAALRASGARVLEAWLEGLGI